MPYFRPAQERPRTAKRFLTAREVEDMAAGGTMEIVHVDGLVITDAARETAHDLGLRIVRPEQQNPAPRQPGPDSRPQAQSQPVAAGAAAMRAQPASGAIAALRVAALDDNVPAANNARTTPSDPLVHAVVRAVRSNLPVLTSLASKG